MVNNRSGHTYGALELELAFFGSIAFDGLYSDGTPQLIVVVSDRRVFHWRQWLAIHFAAQKQLLCDFLCQIMSYLSVIIDHNFDSDCIKPSIIQWVNINLI